MPASPDSPLDIERYRSQIVRYIQFLLRNASEAEDLAQETFIRAHSQQKYLRDWNALGAWLYKIATHVCIDRLRQRSRTNARRSASPVEDLQIEDKAQPSPFAIVQQREMGDCVDQHVAALPDPYKIILLLHDAEGLSDNEIADLLALPLTTVKMRLHRAREKLRKALESACQFGRDERGVYICEPKPGVKPPSVH